VRIICLWQEQCKDTANLFNLEPNLARLEDEGSSDRAAGRLCQLCGRSFLELPGTSFAKTQMALNFGVSC
jgi:hypothetical protein